MQKAISLVKDEVYNSVDYQEILYDFRSPVPVYSCDKTEVSFALRGTKVSAPNKKPRKYTPNSRNEQPFFSSTSHNPDPTKSNNDSTLKGQMDL